MASDHFERPLSRDNGFNIYSDGRVATTFASPFPTSIPTSFPSGACNYVDLTPGSLQAKCGCRRFWVRQSSGSPVLDQSGWCMCNHHACYHDEGGREGQMVLDRTSAGQENERPKIGREPLSPMLDVPMGEPAMIQAYNSFVTVQDHPPSLNGLIAQSSHGGPDYLELYRSAPSMPDTLSWGRDPESQIAMPPIPSQCLLPSQTTSTTSSVHAKYQRPFAGKGLHSLKGPNATVHAQSPLKHQQTIFDGVSQPLDSTHSSESIVFVTPNETSSALMPESGTPKPAPQQALKSLSDQVSGHEQRLERLETQSFSAPGHEDCYDRHEHMDLRVTELESKAEEVERILNSNELSVNRHNNRNDDNISISAVSAATSFSIRAPVSQDFSSQLQSLQARMDQIESSIPSYNRTWEVEIVFLPFPLKRVWQDMQQFKSETSANSDDWTRLPMTNSTHTLRSQSPYCNDWVTPNHDAEWLLPRAFNDKSVIDKRLRSRGFIKTVSINGPDARAVQSAMEHAFRDAFQAVQTSPSSQESDPQATRYLGLNSPWIPLRKIHKDSRLRFLSPAEMISPALWDVQFLHSVMMKSSEPRIFVTHPEAYSQDYFSYESGWTWQKLREIDRVYPDVTESQDVLEADALEECWAPFEQLDESPSTRTSISMRQAPHRVSSSPSIRHNSIGPSWKSAIPVANRAQSPRVQVRRGSRPTPIRTTSSPIPVPPRSASSASRPRILSHGYSRRSSPLVTQGAIRKQRHTRSPSHARFTPRWTGSPSPMPMGPNDRPRGTTPFSYATPHSNAPLQEVRFIRGTSVTRATGEGMEDLWGPDELYNIEIYESASDSLVEGDDDESYSSGSVVRIGPGEIYPGRQLPEDEVWIGIEDETHHNESNMSDGENVDPGQNHDEASATSSQPSEYPSTQAPTRDSDAARNMEDRPNQSGFHIYEDVE